MNYTYNPAARQRKAVRDFQYHRARREVFASQGLTSRGTPRKYAVRRPELQGLRGLTRVRARKRLYTQNLNSLGLSKRGTPLRQPRIQWQMFYEIHRGIKPTPDFESPLERGNN
jgi:hypothetical protein